MINLKKTSLLPIEALLFSLCIIPLSVFTTGELFFDQFLFIPFWVGGILFSMVYGFRKGLIALVVILILPFGVYLLTPSFLTSFKVIHKSQIFYQVLLPEFSATFFSVYILGGQRDRNEQKLYTYMQRLKEMSTRDLLQKRTIRSLEQVNKELEERVSKNNEAISGLYSQIQDLYDLHSDSVLRGLLKLMETFARARKVTIWRYSQAEKSLYSVAHFPLVDNTIEKKKLAIDGSIEGWVYRNNSFFSLRMIYENELLAKLVKKGNILTYPIHYKDQVWGVLNIEDMEFYKYNLYTEHTLSIIMSLAEPALERALEYESKILTDQIDPVTKLPYFSQLYRILSQEFPKYKSSNTPYSVVILEIMNFKELLEDFNSESLKQFLNIMIFQMEDLLGHKGEFFHYKEENQLAVLLPAKDHDGAGQFCLEFLSRINTIPWTLAQKTLNLEIILGYSTLGEEIDNEDFLLDKAEHLLTLQRL